MRIIIEDTQSNGEVPQAQGASMSTPVQSAPATPPNYAGAINAGPAPTGPGQAAQTQQPGATAPSGEPVIERQTATSAGPAPTEV